MSLYFSSLTHSPARDVGPSGKPVISEIAVLAANATGTRVINARSDKSIRIWRILASGLSTPVVIENAHLREVAGVLWNTNTEYSFASVARDCWVKLWKATGQLEREFKVQKAAGPVALEKIEYSPDGYYLAVADSDGSVLLYDVQGNYSKVAEYKAPARVYDLKWPNKGHDYVVAALGNGTVQILSPDVKAKTLKCVHTLKGHKSPVTSVSIDPRGRIIACGTGEGIVSIWKLSDLLNCHVLAKIDQEVAAVEISRDGSYIAVAYTQETNVKVYDSVSLEEIYEVPNSAAGKVGILSISWLPHRGSFVYVGERSRVMEIARKDVKAER